ncbi:MAG: OmpA family protein [Myxococcaceae bacterium]|nr:OmpA family protein [Myxococcaceae bacterium]
MNVRHLLFLLTLAPALAVAQSDEWSTFPGAQNPAPPTATPATPAPVASPPAAGPAKNGAKDGAKDKEEDDKKEEPKSETKAEPIETLSPLPPPGAPTAPAAAQAPAASAGTPLAAEPEPVVVSQEERFLPGTEPHSPSTLDHSWTALDNQRISPNAFGSAGLLHTSSAFLGRKGLLKFGVVGEYLHLNNFPVQEAIDVRSAGTFSVSYVPVEWLEAFAAYSASSNTNNFSSPTLIQALGDVTLGVKAAREWRKGIAAGVEVRLQSFSGVGNQDVSRYAWGIAPRAVASFDIRRFAPEVPLVVHTNLGFAFDSTGSLVSQHRLNASEEFALGTHRFNRFTAGAALEAPLRAVTPFLEWNLGVPLGVPGGTLLSPDGSTVSVAEVMPHLLGLGVKVTAIKDLTLLAAADFGLSRTVGLGIPATPPWNLSLGAAFNIDPFQRGETRVVETLRERKVEAPVPPAPQTARIAGVVLDARTKKPVPGVIVAMVGAGVPPVASDETEGRFLSQELKPGEITLKATHEGYAGATQQVTVQPGDTAQVQLMLEPKARLAHFLITAMSVAPKRQKSVPVEAHVTLDGPTKLDVTTPADGTAAKLDAPAGQYHVTVKADGYLAQLRDVQVSEDGEMKLDFTMEAQPKKKLVIVKNDKIEILQQVHFASGKATILADSYALLNQVLDAIVTHDVKRFRVEGHTDNRGGKKRNLKLSEDRAQAVADYLIKSGIDPSRIEVKGYGDTRPVAPNLTRRGRELNRRVEFVILER